MSSTIAGTCPGLKWTTAWDGSFRCAVLGALLARGLIAHLWARGGDSDRFAAVGGGDVSPNNSEAHGDAGQYRCSFRFKPLADFTITSASKDVNPAVSKHWIPACAGMTTNSVEISQTAPLPK